MSFVSKAFGRLRYLEASPGDASKQRPHGTLLLLHAFPLSARMWTGQASLAGGGWRVIAPDLRGFGPGAGDPAATSVDDYAGDAIDLLDALHVQEVVVAGLSMGGYVAFAILRHAARYVRGLVLADTRSQADTPEGLDARRRMLATLNEKGVGAVAEDMLPKLLAEDTRRQLPDVVERVRALIVENSREAVAGGVSALMTRPDSTPLLHDIHCPTLVVVGEHDALTPVSASEALHRGIAGSELVVIPGAGHLSNIEAPDPFNRTLAQFLEHRV